MHVEEKENFFVEAHSEKCVCHGNKKRFIFIVLVSKHYRYINLENSLSSKKKSFVISELCSKNLKVVGGGVKNASPVPIKLTL